MNQKSKRGTIFLWAFVIISTGFIPLNTPASRVQNPNIQMILEHLDQSKQQLTYSPDQSRKTCDEALTFCRELNNDTLAVEALLQLGNIVSLQGQNTEALAYFNQAKEKSESIQYKKGFCNALLEVGSIHYIWGEYDYAHSLFEEALNVSEKNHFKVQHVKALNLIGKFYHTKGQYDQSVTYYNQAAEACQELGDYDLLVTLFLNIGKTYISKENIYMALNYYLKAFEICEKSGNKLLKADVYNHLGSIYLLLEQPYKSLEYHRKSLTLRKEINSPEAMATSYNNMGETFLFLSDYDSAAVYLHTSYRLCNETGYIKGTIKALTNLGRAYNLLGKLQDAKKYLTDAYDLSESSGYNAGLVESSLTLAENYQLKQEYSKAIRYFDTSLSQMIPANLDEFQSNAFQGLYRCYLNLGDTAKALVYHIKLLDADRKKLQAQRDRQLAELRVSFDSEKKENDNQNLRQENELKQLKIKQKTWIIWTVLIFLISTILLCLLIYNRYLQKHRAHGELKAVIKELELANEEKDKMFSIIAHELRNPLYWFQNLTETLSRNHSKMSPEKLEKSLLSIDESAKNAFHLMDNLLNWSRARLNRIIPRKANHSLIELVNETLQMFETIVRQKEIDFKVNVKDDVTIYADADMFGCILRNLISNAIKYTPVNGQILVESVCTDLICTMKVYDSGIGVSAQDIAKHLKSGSFKSVPGLMQEKGSGLGLKLCKEFTHLNGGNIWVNSEKDKGTCVVFTVPLAKI